jgi:hypothetical protein
MARFWFLKSSAEKTIVAALQSHPDGRWLTDETLAGWGCDFPDMRYGHRYFLMNPGVLLNPSFMGRFPLAGMHGFDPAHEDSVAFFATNDFDTATPKGLEDLRGALSHSIGLTKLGLAA